MPAHVTVTLDSRAMEMDGNRRRGSGEDAGEGGFGPGGGEAGGAFEQLLFGAVVAEAEVVVAAGGGGELAGSDRDAVAQGPGGEGRGVGAVGEPHPQREPAGRWFEAAAG